MQTFVPGYPTDLRSYKQQMRAFNSVVGDFEQQAARVIARLTGEHVILQDDNSRPSMVDIRIERPGLHNGYAEVVFDVNPDYAALQAGVRQRQVMTAPSLNRTWFVTVGPAARLRDLHCELTGILESLESAGEFLKTATFDQDLANHANKFVRTLAGKGVVRLLSGKLRSGEHGTIQMGPVGIGGLAQLDWTMFDGWLTEFLASDRLRDVRKKLAATGSPELHVFIGLSFTTPWPVYHALYDDYRDSLPPLDPTLPPEITHLWLCAQTGRCIAWFPDRGWFEPMRHWVTG
ncbi:MAG: hypothetical protein ACRDRP_19360 [Pseudonocardiaceae bacterium]